MRIIGVISLLFFVYGGAFAFLGYVPWYVYFVVGGAVFLACLNQANGEKTLLSLYRKDKKKLVKIYFLYTIAALLIELVGRGLLGLWHYNFTYQIIEIINVFLVTYQFAFFFIYELFVILRNKIKNYILLFISLVIINSFLHEIPNTFANEWTYTIPYISFEILNINIMVIIGWSILVAVPLAVKKLLS